MFLIISFCLNVAGCDKGGQLGSQKQQKDKPSKGKKSNFFKRLFRFKFHKSSRKEDNASAKAEVTEEPRQSDAVNHGQSAPTSAVTNSAPQNGDQNAVVTVANDTNENEKSQGNGELHGDQDSASVKVDIVSNSGAQAELLSDSERE